MGDQTPHTAGGRKPAEGKRTTGTDKPTARAVSDQVPEPQTHHEREGRQVVGQGREGKETSKGRGCDAKERMKVWALDAKPARPGN